MCRCYEQPGVSSPCLVRERNSFHHSTQQNLLVRNSFVHLQTRYHLTQEQRRQHNSPVELLPLMGRQHLARLQQCIEMSIAAGRNPRSPDLQL